MIFTSALILCLCWLTQSAQAQVIGLGQCPNVKAVQNFNASAILGKWYKYAKYFNLPEAGLKCETTTLEASESGINIETVGYRLGSKVTIHEAATPASDDNSAKLTLKFDYSPFSYPTFIIAADYESYAVVWCCIDAGNFANSQRAWIITRDRKPSKEVIDAAYAAMTENKLSTSKMGVIIQTDCEKYES